MIKMKCNKNCKYMFDESELKDLASKVSEAIAKEEELEREKVEVMAGIKARIETNKRDLRETSKKYRDGYEWRSIECTVIPDYIKGTVAYSRNDTGEVVEDRKMTSSERQQEIGDVVTRDEMVQS